MTSKRSLSLMKDRVLRAIPPQAQRFPQSSRSLKIGSIQVFLLRHNYDA